jgi:hypothetical protein
MTENNQKTSGPFNRATSNEESWFASGTFAEMKRTFEAHTDWFASGTWAEITKSYNEHKP